MYDFGNGPQLARKAGGVISPHCPYSYEDNQLPDYLEDLNAMHEAEKILNDGIVWSGYLNNLRDVVWPQFNQMGGLNAAIGLLLVHATADQRAKAFLKTIGKWEQS